MWVRGRGILSLYQGRCSNACARGFWRASGRGRDGSWGGIEGEDRRRRRWGGEQFGVILLMRPVSTAPGFNEALPTRHSEILQLIWRHRNSLSFGAAGLPLIALLHIGGVAEMSEAFRGGGGSSGESSGVPFLRPPYGDSEAGARQIAEGYDAKCSD